MYDVKAIRGANPIEEVVVDSGVQLRKEGSLLVGLCPFHEDRRPSMAVYPATASYYCFGCGAGGDVIDFVSRLKQADFKSTVRLLEANPCVPHGNRPSKPKLTLVESRPSAGLSQAERTVIDVAARFYEDGLANSATAQSYLQVRGIRLETAMKHRLGFGAPGLLDHLRRCGIKPAAAERVGLLARNRETMRGRLVVPEITGDRVTWLTGRSVCTSGPRYLSLKLPVPILGLRSIQTDWVVVTEGPFDWLTAVQWGYPAIALLGVRVSKVVVSALSRFSCVYLALDADQAGRMATDRLIEALGLHALPVTLPSGVHDLNDLGHDPAGCTSFIHCLQAAGDREEETTWRTEQIRTAQRAA